MNALGKNILNCRVKRLMWCYVCQCGKRVGFKDEGNERERESEREKAVVSGLTHRVNVCGCADVPLCLLCPRRCLCNSCERETRRLHGNGRFKQSLLQGCFSTPYPPFLPWIRVFSGSETGYGLYLDLTMNLQSRQCLQAGRYFFKSLFQTPLPFVKA